MQINAARCPMEHCSSMFGHQLARDIAVIVVVKMAIIIAAGLMVFGPQRPRLTSSSITAHLLHSTPEAN